MNYTPEVRYAVIVGIDDYETAPLRCCVRDADGIADVLERRCRFERENIIKITSSTDNQNKELYGTLENTLTDIQKKFVAEQDSLLFYFAGHGYKSQTVSVLKFHELEVKIVDIFNKFNNLNPKFQMYVIDACESGGKVLTRKQSAFSPQEFVDNLVGQATGILFMYASTDEEIANEQSDLGHGIFTHFFLKAIEDPANYRDGILSPSVLQDRIAYETQRSTKFKQNPVIENRSIGFYPFSFLESYTKKITGEHLESISTTVSQENETTHHSKFPLVDHKQVEMVFNEALAMLRTEFESFAHKVDQQLFEYQISLGLNSIGNSDKIAEALITHIESSGIDAINNIFITEQVDIRNRYTRNLGMIDAFLRNQNNFKTEYRISWKKDFIIGKSIYLKSKSINTPSCAFGIIIYKAKFGLGVGTLQYRTDWNGESEVLERNPSVSISGYKVDSEVLSKIQQDTSNSLSDFSKNILKWIQLRKEEIEKVDKLYK
jgi:hypothetical protein